MRKILFLVPLFALLMTMHSCGDNEDVSVPHILTDAELQEMHRQDSIDSVNRNRYADFIVETSVELKAGGQYEGQEVAFDFNAIASFFGLSPEALAAGIDDKTVTACIIKGSNLSAYTDGSTANGNWGYWVDKQGDPMSWGTGCAAYCEWYSDDNPSVFYVGQFPDALQEGSQVTFIPALKYQGKTAAVKITITIVAAS